MTPFDEHLSQLLRLRDMFVFGMADSPEADALRDAMLPTWNRLTAVEKAHMERIAANIGPWEPNAAKSATGGNAMPSVSGTAG